MKHLLVIVVTVISVACLRPVPPVDEVVGEKGTVADTPADGGFLPGSTGDDDVDEDSSPWVVIVPPAPEDCWKTSDVERVTWKFGKDINALSFDSPACADDLSGAVSDGDSAAVKSLFEKAPKIDSACRVEYEWTLLHVASMGGLAKIAGLLIKKGADVKSCDMNGETPLHYAVKEGHLSVAKLLLSKGAYSNAVDISGRKPLHLVWVGAYGINGDLNFKLSLAMTRQLVKNGADVNAADGAGETPLHVAANYGDLAAVKFLVKKGASVDAKDSKGRRPVDLTEDPRVARYLEPPRKSTKSGAGIGLEP